MQFHTVIVRELPSTTFTVICDSCDKTNSPAPFKGGYPGNTDESLLMALGEASRFVATWNGSTTFDIIKP